MKDIRSILRMLLKQRQQVQYRILDFPALFLTTMSRTIAVTMANGDRVKRRNIGESSWRSHEYSISNYNANGLPCINQNAGELVMPFYNPSEIPSTEIIPGCHSRIISGERIMLSVLDMPKGSVLPEHDHPHEQAGMVLEGRLSLTIGGEERVLHPGEAYVVPGSVKHSGFVVDEDVKVLDVFSPPREDYLAQS